MITHVRVRVTSSLAVLFSAVFVAVSPASAQYRVNTGYQAEPEEPNGPSLTPYGGYMSFAPYQSSQTGASAGGGGGTLVGMQFMLPLSEHFAILGNGAHANTNLNFGAPYSI